ncbi:MAG: hypothetical protein ACTS22_05660 [Phycisphaerales bacterium]
MLADDPRLYTALFGVALPGVIGVSGAVAGWMAGAIARRRRSAGASPRDHDSLRTGFGPALGLGAAFATMTVAFAGWPERWPVSASDWVAPIVVLSAVLAAAVDLFPRPRKRSIATWVGRLAVAGLILYGPLARPRANFWEGSTEILWHAGIALWLLLAWAGADRITNRLRPIGQSALAAIAVAGVVPVVFGAGVTAQSQYAGGLAAAVVGAGLIAVVSAGIVATRSAGSVLVTWLAMVLLISYQYVSEMAWWEFGVIAALPLLLGALVTLPGLRKLSPAKQGWIAVVLAAAGFGAVSGHHVPELRRELTGSGSSIDDYYGY